MAPPLPDASQPSKSTHSGGPICAADLAAEGKPQPEQPVLLLGQLAGLLLPAQPEGQVHVVEASHAA